MIEDDNLVNINTHMALPRVLDKSSPHKIKKINAHKENSDASVAVISRYLPTYGFKDYSFKDLFLSYRLYEKKLNKIVRKHRMAIQLQEKYKVLYLELQRRLKVDSPSDDVKAVTDTDDSFFCYLSCHPRGRGPPLFKSLQFIYEKQLRMKQGKGYRLDTIFNIETNHKKQLKIYHDCVKLYSKQIKLFDTFISEDYERSIMCLRRSEMLFSSQIEKKIAELKNLAITQLSLQSILIGIDYLYHQQRKYGRFLYYISPHNWRARNREFASSIEIETKGFDLGTSNEEDTFNVIFENMKEECAEGLIKPVLYFTEPAELMNIFVSTEKRQLHHFMHVTQMNPNTETMFNVIKILKTCIKIDTDFVAHIIEDVENLLNFDDVRASQLQAKFIKILYSTFYDSVAAKDVIQLQTHLEWCYEMIFNAKPNATMLSTAKALEDMFMEYSFNLESFGSDVSKKALKQSLAEESKKMTRAKKAARELILFNRLQKSLLRAYGMAHLPVKRPLVRKQKGKEIKPSDRRDSTRLLSEAEIEYLQLFTDWTETKDPAKYLNSF